MQHTHGDKYGNRESYIVNAPILQRPSSKCPSWDPKWTGEKWFAAISLLIEQCGKSEFDCKFLFSRNNRSDTNFNRKFDYELVWYVAVGPYYRQHKEVLAPNQHLIISGWCWSSNSQKSLSPR